MSDGPGFLARVRSRLARALAPVVARVGRSGYAGALLTRLTSDWVLAGLRSADQDVQGDLRRLRDRSRELVRNSAYAARFHQLIAENVIGADGMTLQAKNAKADGELFDKANRAIEDAWKEWSRPENCDNAGMLSLNEQLSLAVSGLATDGEILIRKIRGSQANGWNFSIQLLDPDFIDENWRREPAGGLNAIRNGVEVDDNGTPVALWMWTRHPAEFPLDRKRIRVDIADVYHVFIPGRPGQHRGLPWMAPVMLRLKMLDGYFEAVLVAARSAAATMGTIEIPDPEKATGLDPTAGAQDQLTEVEPGTFKRLNPGETLKIWDPKQPSTTVEQYTRVSLREIAAGWGISYSTLTGDLSDANFSSMRIGWIGERDHWARIQEFIATHLLDRLYRDWLPMALLAGKLPAFMGVDVTKWQTLRWQPRGFPWIDPKKEIEGDLLEVNAGINSLTRVAAKKGRDIEDIVEERKRELALFKEANVPSVLATTITESPKTELPDNADDPEAPNTVTPTGGNGRMLTLAARRAANE